MYNANQARTLVQKQYPDVKVEDCFLYENLFLVRVKHLNPDEADYDPFFSVDRTTGLVNEFSILTDGDPVAIAEAFQNRE